MYVCLITYVWKYLGLYLAGILDITMYAHFERINSQRAVYWNTVNTCLPLRFNAKALSVTVMV